MFNKWLPFFFILLSGYLQILVSASPEDPPKKIYVSPVSSKPKPTRDTVQTANSNAYEYIEEVRPIHYSGHGYGYGDGESPAYSSGHSGGHYESYGSAEDAYGPPPMTSYGAPKQAIEHRYYTIRKSKSMFSDDVGFVIIVVGLTVFFGALS